MMEIETQKENELREKNGCFAYGIPSMKRARNYQLSSSTISALFSGPVGEREGEGGEESEREWGTCHQSLKNVLN